MILIGKEILIRLNIGIFPAVFAKITLSILAKRLGVHPLTELANEIFTISVGSWAYTCVKMFRATCQTFVVFV